METRSLGASGLKVPVICLGTMTFGEADENSFMHNVGANIETSFRIMDRSLDLGVNFWDTADVYGQDGLSERVIGNWLKDRKKREEVILATKFRFRMNEGPNGSGASRYRIMRAVEGSLKRLGTDRIDLYQIHMQDIDVPEEEILRAFDDLIRQGKILYAGCSNYAAYRLALSLGKSEQNGYCRFVSAQMQYSLACRDIEREHVPLCKAEGLGILPWSPLASGFLSGKYRKGEPAPEGTRLATWKERFGRYDSDAMWRLIDAIRLVAKEVEAECAQVALAWLLTKPVVSSVIIGARSVEQLEENVAATSVVLSEEQVAALDAASELTLGYPYDFIQRVQQTW